MDRSQLNAGPAPNASVDPAPAGDPESAEDTEQTAGSASSRADAIRTEVVVGPPTDCPVARASAATGATAHLVGRTANPQSTDPAGTRVVGEFELPASVSSTDLAPLDCDPVFRTATGIRCRFDEDRTEPCPCDVIESRHFPLAATVARRGRLHLSFHALDVDRVREVVTALRRRFDDVSVRRLRTAADEASTQHVVVDRGALTARQLEVLETAFDLGYFDHPRNATGCDVADALDIAPSTYAEHLAAAQRKIMADVLAH